jgi:hypothetical protein
MHRVQEPQLRHDEEQEDEARAPRIQQVLPPLPLPPFPQGDEIKDEGGRMKDEGAVDAFTSSFILPPSSFRLGV